MLHNFVAKKDAHVDKLIINHSLTCAKDSLDFDADLNPKSTLGKKIQNLIWIRLRILIMNITSRFTDF